MTFRLLQQHPRLWRDCGIIPVPQACGGTLSNKQRVSIQGIVRHPSLTAVIGPAHPNLLPKMVTSSTPYFNFKISGRTQKKRSLNRALHKLCYRTYYYNISTFAPHDEPDFVSPRQTGIYPLLLYGTNSYAWYRPHPRQN